MRRRGSQRLIASSARVLYRTGLLHRLSRVAGSVARPPAFQILTYHRVNDQNDPFFGAVPTSVFEARMRYIAETHTVLPVEELVERAQQGSLPRNALAITFDDGYRDNLTHAAPVLRRLGLPATIFLATGLIGTGQIAWFDRLAVAFKLTKADSVVTPWGDVFTLRGQAGRLHALERTLGYLKLQADDACRRSVDTLVDALAAPDQHDGEGLMLTWDDVAALGGLGFSIGAHSITHPILSRVDTARARTEIEGSRSMIAASCRTIPRAFAYPNGGAGDYTEATAKIVSDAGFTCAVTTRFGLNTARTRRFELRRGGPWEHELPTFAFKLTAYRLRSA